jgi:hypothetical protein
MFAPAVTPELAEHALIGAAVHALAVRVSQSGNPGDRTDLDFARRIPSPDELAESSTVYAISLVWWAHSDIGSRRGLLDAATRLMLYKIADDDGERRYESGYRIYASQLLDAALSPKAHAKEVDVSHLVSGVKELDLMTARFADTAVAAVLLSDCQSFGDPARSAETMRDEMIHLAYAPQAA